MPPAKRPHPRRALYWWSAEIASLRAACNGARREYTGSRRRRPQDVDRDDRLRKIYVEKTKILRQAIVRTGRWVQTGCTGEFSRSLSGTSTPASGNCLTAACGLASSRRPGRRVDSAYSLRPRLSEFQFGFRARRSTVDALKRLQAVTGEAEHRREVVVAVSLDIANACNSLPQTLIREALKYFGVPPYLRRLLEAYLSDRRVGLENWSGSVEWRRVGCSVPQGLVLGPIQWDNGYDWVLRSRLLPGMGVICYADDTLVYSPGRTAPRFGRIASLRGIGLRCALRRGSSR
ncbi:unnamed protein product [Euphydryas editha]|uniref:Reverse transcriptase domain-containing protein n=1 Tax=Euphydryas editha TaxID=104508 RepID=A0AAU9UHN3_EUPED|nr:unnamed protein product [Euphydryas editha]